MTTIITSLNPKIKRIDESGNDYGMDYQRQCVESWTRAGANVISLNTSDEIDRLSKFDERINFVAVELSPFVPGGRALPGICDAIRAAARVQDDVVVITNADIKLDADVRYLRHFARHVARRDFLVANRVDIERPSSNSGTLYPYGYDVFAFHSSKAWELDGSGFKFGSPWWDYWLPINALISGFNVKLLESENFHHVAHEWAWNWPEWNHGFRLTAKKIQSRLDYSEQIDTARDLGLGFFKYMLAVLADDSMNEATLKSNGPFVQGEQLATFLRMVINSRFQKVK